MNPTITLPKAGAVYLIHATGTSFYKIGCSGDPEARRCQLDVVSPFALELVAEMPASDMYRAESEWHVRFAAKRVRGEWFNLDCDDVLTIMRAAIIAHAEDIYRTLKASGMNSEERRVYFNDLLAEMRTVVLQVNAAHTPSSAVEWNAS